jgi:hypothetical protein
MTKEMFSAASSVMAYLCVMELNWLGPVNFLLGLFLCLESELKINGRYLML